jgi:hypothetical protein
VFLYVVLRVFACAFLKSSLVRSFESSYFTMAVTFQTYYNSTAFSPCFDELPAMADIEWLGAPDAWRCYDEGWNCLRPKSCYDALYECRTGGGVMCFVREDGSRYISPKASEALLYEGGWVVCYFIPRGLIASAMRGDFEECELRFVEGITPRVVLPPERSEEPAVAVLVDFAAPAPAPAPAPAARQSDLEGVDVLTVWVKLKVNMWMFLFAQGRCSFTECLKLSAGTEEHTVPVRGEELAELRASGVEWRWYE